MKAMLLERLSTVTGRDAPLRLTDMAEPVCGPGEVLIRVHACGVCHTELDEIEGRTPPARLPMILGHQVVGEIATAGSEAKQWGEGDRVGVAWIHSTCGVCHYCRSGRENLCADFRATGRDHFGGYAQWMTARADFVFRIPAGLADADAAPLLCAGAIGYRSLRLTNLEDGQNLGLMGFGASAHLVLKIAMHRFPRARVFAFARDERERGFAKELGAVWTGHTNDRSPILLDAIIDTTPAWTPVIGALSNLAPGGRVVINAIRKEETDKTALSRIDYPTHLWLEKEVKSVANVCRQDVQDLLAFAPKASLRPQIRAFPLADANQALIELKTRSIPGAKVLMID
jgi:propanol-preferring alcohol dehydrogenase